MNIKYFKLFAVISFANSLVSMDNQETIEQRLSKVAQNNIIFFKDGNISVWDNELKDKPVVILIHGNSASGKIFIKQFESDLGKKYRLIAIDLPGHGNSDLREDPLAYSFIGYAKIIAEVINKLNIKKATIVGWSLGGHIALELSLLIPKKINGIFITGTPPIVLSPEGMEKGFKPNPEILGLLGYPEQFTKEQAKTFMGLGGISIDSPQTQFLITDAVNTKGIARKNMVDAMIKGIGNDETKIVSEMKIPLGIVAGENDVGINNEYIEKLKYGNLWNNKVNIIKNAGHAVFWENADEFNSILSKFLESVNK